MPCRHVSDFMADDAGEFRLGVDIGEDPASEVNISAWNREGVNYRRIHCGVVPVQVRPMRNRGEFLSDRLYVALNSRRVEKTELTLRRDVRLRTESDLLTLRNQNNLPFAGYGISCTTEQGNQGEEKQNSLDAQHKVAAPSPLKNWVSFDRRMSVDCC